MNKIAITSIAPGHKNFENQHNAIQSWIDNDFKVISMNHPDEIGILEKTFKDVEFVPTLRTNQRLFGKPYVVVSAIIDYLKIRPEDKFMLINSDIIIYDSWEIEKELYVMADNGVVILNRYNYDEEFKTAKFNEGGFDAFLINKKFLDIFPQTVLCLGQCFWDYWVPYQCVLSGVPIYNHTKAYIFHKNHAVQYSSKQHEITCNIFRGELSAIDTSVKQNMTVSQLSQHVYFKIKEKFIYEKAH